MAADETLNHEVEDKLGQLIRIRRNAKHVLGDSDPFFGLPVFLAQQISNALFGLFTLIGTQVYSVLGHSLDDRHLFELFPALFDCRNHLFKDLLHRAGIVSLEVVPSRGLLY